MSSVVHHTVTYSSLDVEVALPCFSEPMLHPTTVLNAFYVQNPLLVTCDSTVCECISLFLYMPQSAAVSAAL